MTQSKFNCYLKNLPDHVTKPESRFIYEVVLGLFKSHRITTNQIVIHIQDKIRLKKTLERFRRHFQKRDFWGRLIEDQLVTLRRMLKIGTMS